MSAVDLLPGDKVLFRGQEWEVFIVDRNQTKDSTIDIFRYTYTDRCSPVDHLVRYRSELELIR